MTKLKINVNDKNEIVSDSDNLAHSFEFYADDSDDKNLKIVMKYFCHAEVCMRLPLTEKEI